MWSHLERQAGGRVRGMGEKQLEVDKRLMRTRIGQLQVPFLYIVVVGGREGGGLFASHLRPGCLC